MTDCLTREQAARLLEVTLPCSPGQLKRAYRRAARQHHPDRGGDARRFHDLQAAYQRLATDHAAPSVVNGRPSRTARTAPSTPSQVVIGTIRTDLDVPDVHCGLTPHLLASALARPHPGPVHPVRATSRAPGASLNRVAGVLAADQTSHLQVRPDRDDRGVATVTIEVAASGRRARRALDGADLAGAWTLRRRTASTTLSARVVPAASRSRTAATAAAHLDRLLEQLVWPLEQWTLTREGTDGG